MAKHTYSLTFRGRPVRFTGTAKQTTTSVYDALHFVLTYRRDADGSIAMTPSIAAAYKTPETALREIKKRDVLRQWEGQSFVIKAYPGTTEITEADVVG